MYRVCLTINNGSLIEMQSGGRVIHLPQKEDQTDENYQEYIDVCDTLESVRLYTLKQNALNAGYKENEIEVKWITEEEWVDIQVVLNTPLINNIGGRKRLQDMLLVRKIKKL